MIEGMEILKKTEITEKELSEFWWVWLVAGLAVAAGLIVLSCWKASRERCEYFTIVTWWPVIFSAAALVTLFFFFNKAFKNEDVPTGKYEYEVTLDDSASLKEVYEHYEVVDIKGDIYVLRDLEPVENICSNCKATVEDEDNFCPECGIKR